MKKPHRKVAYMQILSGLRQAKNFGIDLAFPTLSARAKIKTNEFVTGNYSYEIVNRLTSFLHAK